MSVHDTQSRHGLPQEQPVHTQALQESLLQKLKARAPNVRSNFEVYAIKLCDYSKIQYFHKNDPQPGMRSVHDTDNNDAIYCHVYDVVPYGLPAEETTIGPRIVDVSCTWFTGLGSIQCQALVNTLPGHVALQNVSQFPAIRMSMCIRSPMPMIIVHRLFNRSGKVISQRAKTEEFALYGAMRMLLYLRRTWGQHALMTNYKVTNIVSNMRFGSAIHTVRIATDYKSSAKYKPSRFPALFLFNSNITYCVFLIFPGGQIIVSAVSNSEHLAALNRLALEIVRPYRTTNEIIRSAIEDYKQNNECAVPQTEASRMTDISMVYNAGRVGEIVAEHKKAANEVLRILADKTMQQASQQAIEYEKHDTLALGPGFELDDGADFPSIGPIMAPSNDSAPVVVFESDSDDDDDTGMTDASALYDDPMEHEPTNTVSCVSDSDDEDEINLDEARIERLTSISESDLLGALDDW